MDLQVGVNKGSILNFPRDDNRADRLVEGKIDGAVSVDGVVHLEPSPDGRTVDVIPVAAGTTVYTASADADVSAAGTRVIVGNAITINVAAAAIPMATHIESEEGPVVPQ